MTDRAAEHLSSSPDIARASLLWAVEGHAAAIARLHAELFAAPWDEPAIARLLAHPASVALVATRGAPLDVSGFVLAQIAADEAEILTIGVAPDDQRGGLGTRLVDAIKRAAAQSGARALFLEVADGNLAARALYARTGFAEAGRRKGYYVREGAPAEDAIVMRCALAVA